MVMPVSQRCPKCGNQFMGSDAIGGLCWSCEMGEILNVPFVFWRCPDHPQGNVSWNHDGEVPVATCETCERKSNT